MIRGRVRCEGLGCNFYNWWRICGIDLHVWTTGIAANTADFAVDNTLELVCFTQSALNT